MHLLKFWQLKQLRHAMVVSSAGEACSLLFVPTPAAGHIV